MRKNWRGWLYRKIGRAHKAVTGEPGTFPGDSQEWGAKRSYVTLLLGSEMAEGLNEAFQGPRRRKLVGGGAQAHLLTSFEVGAFLRVSRWTLGDWRRAGTGPPFVKISGRVVRYPVTGLKRFLNQNLGGSSLGRIPSFRGRSIHGTKDTAVPSRAPEVS